MKKVMTKEEIFEQNINSIYQNIWNSEEIKTILGTYEKLYLFCGSIMAGLQTEGVEPLKIEDLKGSNTEGENDGDVMIKSIESFLHSRHCTDHTISMIFGYFKPVFGRKDLWVTDNNDSIIKTIYRQIKEGLIPLLEGENYTDFTNKLLNYLNYWVSVEKDKQNDVVLTPRNVMNLMARICKVSKKSYIWDTCMGSAGFLVTGLNLMIADAKETITDKEELKAKIEDIRQNQLTGVEILGNVYILAVLNMLLMGSNLSGVICGDSHDEIKRLNFPADVFLLNPPYSAEGKGLIFASEALDRMESGYGAVLIQENAGSGQGAGFSKHILEKHSLISSIHMPSNLFIGKASVQTAIYLFKVNRPHELDDVVTFIDFSEDGYSRQNRKKSTQEVNLRNTDHALERYDEVVAICLGKKPQTEYYTETNGKVIKDTITLEGNDWTFSQHKKIDTTPTEEDFKKTVADYLAWKVSAILKGQVSADV